MDYTLSNSFDTHAGTGNRMHEDAKAVPTVVSAKDMNSLIWSLMEVIRAAGLNGAQFDKATPATYRLLLKALRNGGLLYGVDSGAANLAVVDFAPAIDALTDGMVLRFKAKATNTGATTLNVNGLGAKAIVGAAQSALQGGEIVADGKCEVIWSATANAFVLVSSSGARQQAPAATQSGHVVSLGQFLGSKSVNGYQQLPSGLLVQWGTTAAAAQGSYVRTTFPVAFPNAVFAVVASPVVSGVNTNGYTVGAVSLTLSTFDMTNNSSSSGPVSSHFIAIGH